MNPIEPQACNALFPSLVPHPSPHYLLAHGVSNQNCELLVLINSAQGRHHLYTCNHVVLTVALPAGHLGPLQRLLKRHKHAHSRTTVPYRAVPCRSCSDLAGLVFPAAFIPHNRE